jgi:hypothetical protein
MAPSPLNLLTGRAARLLVSAAKELLQGKRTDANKAKAFVSRLKSEGAARMTIINYTRGGREFVHQIRARKITDDGREYYFTESCEVRGTAITDAICARARLPSVRPPWHEELLLVVLWAVGLGVVMWHCITTLSKDSDWSLPPSGFIRDRAVSSDWSLPPSGAILDCAVSSDWSLPPSGTIRDRAVSPFLMPLSAFDHGMMLIG